MQNPTRTAPRFIPKWLYAVLVQINTMLISDDFLKYTRNYRRLFSSQRGARITSRLQSGEIGTINSQPRDRWVQDQLRLLPQGQRLLDVGAGERQYMKFCDHLDYVSQDLAQYDGSGNQEGFHQGVWDTSGIDIVSDIASMPVKDGSFDAIMCTEVLEHVPDPVRAIEEMTRVLKPGGTMLITAPFCSLTHFAPEHHATGFSRFFYRHHLERLGFENIEITPNGNFFHYLAQEARRVESMAERYSSTEVENSEKWVIASFIKMLERIEQYDTGSDDVLVFGYHVKANKKERQNVKAKSVVRPKKIQK